MRTALVLFLLISLVSASTTLDPYVIQKEYYRIETYYLSAQQSCGGFFSCTPNYIRADVFVAYYFYNTNPLAFKSALSFDEYVYNTYYNIWTILDSDNDIYTWWPLFDVLAALSLNVSDNFIVTVENIINTNFGNNGLMTALPVHYKNYFGNIPYDLVSTLLALDIAQKSELVDGNLNFTKLNSTLNPQFWNYVLKYVSGQISAPLATASNRALVALLSLGMKWMRMRICNALNDTFFSPVYSSYLRLEPLDYGRYATGLLAEEAQICGRLGFLNQSYADAVTSWLVQSYAMDNGGFWPNSTYAFSLYGLLMRSNSKDYELVATDVLPRVQPPQQSDSQTIITMIAHETVTKYKTLYVPITLYSNTTTTSSSIEVVGLPFSGLPTLLLFQKRKRKDTSSTS